MLNNIGHVYDGMRQPQQALNYYKQALALHRQVRDKDGEATTLGNIGSVFNVMGQPQQALNFFKQALSLCHSIGNKRGEATMLSNIGVFYWQHHKMPQAEDALKRSIALVETIRESLGGLSTAKVAYLENELGTYGFYDDVLLQEGKAGEAFALEQKMKARALLDEMAGGRASLRKALTSEERAREQMLRQACDTLNKQMIGEGARNEIGSKKRFIALQEQLRQAERELSKYTDTLNTLHPEFARQRAAHTLTATEAVKILPLDTALVEYAVLDAGKPENRLDRVVVFVVTPDGKTTAHTLPIHATQLGKQSAAFRAACADPRKSFLPLSHQLYNTLIAPFSSRLAGKKHLLICPDGPLWDVPFVALMAEEKEHLRSTLHSQPSTFLADRFLITYAYSATGAQAALLARPAGATTGDVLALANPNFGDAQRFGDSVVIPGQRPFEAPSRPFFTPDRPFEAPSRPFEAPSRPFEAPSRIWETPNRFFEVPSRFFNAPSRPFEAPSRPFEAPSRPFEAPSRPLPLPTRPFEAPSRPFEAPSRDFLTQLRGGIASLPGTQREADVLRKLYPDAAIYTREQAQEGTFKAEAGKYKYLHLASHAFFNDAAPMLSSVFLAAPPKIGAGSEEDGFLTARELLDMDLHADMVVLSACQTARGEKHSGEGIVGMTWALFVAGCPTQVLSQWSVDDTATALLMARFYQELKSGAGKRLVAANGVTGIAARTELRASLLLGAVPAYRAVALKPGEQTKK